MRCPACGARNPGSAQWCGQCFASLEQGPAASTPQPAAAPEQREATSSTPSPQAPGRPQAGEGQVASLFRRTAEGIDWRCEVCDTWNPIERTTCSVCGAAFSRTVAAPEERRPLVDVPPAVPVLATAVLPGAGHVLLGAVTSGVARLLLYAVWLLGGLLLLREAVGAEASTLPAVPLLAGAIVLALGSLMDVMQLQRGSASEVLGPRALLWLTVGVLGLTMLSLVVSALQATGG